MNGLEFATPWAFVLLVLPLLLALGRQPAPPDGGLVLPNSIRDSIHASRGERARARPAWRTLAPGFVWLSLVFALAGPRIADAVAALPASGRDIMLVLDLSGSMLKRDFALDGVQMSRLDLVKHVGSELIRRREGDRIGLVVFAETAFAAAPLTFDLHAVDGVLQEMEIGVVGRSTAIGEGLGLALKRLSQSTAPSRVVILLSDGANNAGSSEPMAVAALARGMNVKIYTIGLGVEDSTSSPEDADAVDFAALQKVAELGAGAALRARTGADLDAAARAIDALIAGPAPAPARVIFRDLWIYPAAAAFALGASLTLASRMKR